MKLLIVLTALLLSGCATYNPYKNMSPAEKIWQLGHLADVSQTVSIAKDPLCYSENNPVTKAIIGKKPSVESVILWGMGSSYLHAQAGNWLDNTDMFSEKSKKLIRVLDIGVKINSVHNNYTIGLTFGTGNNHVDEYCRSTR